MDWQTQFDAMMDQDQPDWRIQLADERDLRELAQARITTEQLANRIRSRLCHVIRCAAIIGKDDK